MGLMVPMSVAAPAASADTPASTDVLFVFDTTGSMGGAITEAKDEIQEAMAQIGASLPNVQFGLAEVRDYDEVNNAGPFSYGIGEGYEPWTLHVPITPNESQVASALLGLFAEGGGDGPEAYGRALWESDVNSSVGWRPGARGVIVLVADNIPHDNDVNEGIPGGDQVSQSPPFPDTGVDPGRDNTVGTSDDLDWQSTVLQQLINDGKPLGTVDYYGGLSGYLPYWEHWAGLTGGTALNSEGGFLGEEIVTLVKQAANAALPSCPSGQVRDSNEHCVPAPSPPPPPPPPSNHFKFEPRISCARGCHVVLVKITFDSAGNVIGESIPEEEGKASSAVPRQAGATISARHKQGRKAKCGGKRRHGKKGAKSSARRGKKGKKKCKRRPLIRKLHQAVVAGTNTLRLRLTRAALKTLHRSGKVKLRVRFTFTPTGGVASVSDHTYVVKMPRKKHKGKVRGGHSKGKAKSKRG
jgi:hypothetical protein